MNINHERLVPGSITYWGDVLGDITDQQDLVDYVASHGGGGGGGGDATWGSIQGTLSDQTDLNNRLTDIDGLALEAYNIAKDTDNALGDHIAANNAAFAEAFSRISALEQGGGGGGGGVTPEEFNAHKAQNAAEFQIVDGRLTALEQNPGVSQQDFINHVDQNDAAFAEAFDRINALEQGGSSSASWGSITGFIANQQDLMTIVGDFEDRFAFLDSSAVIYEQSPELGFEDYYVSSLTWQPTLYSWDDYYTPDDNRIVTACGSYMDTDDDYRMKFGKVNTTFEQDPNTQEYFVTGQTFGEMMTLTRKEGIDFPMVDRPNTSVVGDFNSDAYILGLNEHEWEDHEEGVNKKNRSYVYVDGNRICKREQEYIDDDGDWVLDKNYEYELAWTGEGWNVLWRHELNVDPFVELPGNYPIDMYYDVAPEESRFGFLDESTWEFNGFKFDENYNLGKYKVEGVEDGSEITYEETFIPYIAAEAPDTSIDATYVLKATVQDGEVTYEWVPDNVL